MQHIFSLQIVGADEGALLRERVAGACCGSKLPRVYRPLKGPGAGENTLRRLALFVYLDHQTKNDVTSGKKASPAAKSNFNLA